VDFADLDVADPAVLALLADLLELLTAAHARLIDETADDAVCADCGDRTSVSFAEADGWTCQLVSDERLRTFCAACAADQPD
jgi:hypothetical protein